MLVKDAKAAARRWVAEEGSAAPGFAGAFYHGSINWLPDDAALSNTSDLDIMIVLADPNVPLERGKFRYRDVLIEASLLPRDRLESPERILGDYHLAGSFRGPSIIADPSGQLAALQAAVAKDYAKRQWVVARCEHAMNRILRGYELHAADPFPDQVMAWLFPAGITTHVLLAAGLKNPTVRQRYAAVRALLAEYGHLNFYERLLELLGCAAISRARVEQHLAALTEAFDVTTTLVRTPFSFASDLSDIARPIAIEGSRQLIERGQHREAIFWIAVTYSRCQKALGADAPVELQQRFHPGYHDLLGDLGIRSFADLQRRLAQVRAFVPRVWEVAEAILAANPAVV